MKTIHTQPLTPNQNLLQTAIERSSSQLVIATGSAGTGKTYVSMNSAANCLARGQYKQLILSRPNQPTGRSLGYFPGTVAEKLEPWLAPMLSVLKERMNANEYESKRKKSVFIQPMEVIRGYSFEEAIIAVDEAQNMTWEEIKSVTTRVGKNSKLLLLGDETQSDIRQPSLSRLSALIKDNSLDCDIINFSIDDIVRSDLVADLVRAYAKE